VTLDPGQRLEGDVVDRFGSVAEDAAVRIEGLPATHTDAQGHFVIAAVPSGSVTLHVTHESAGAVDVVRNVVRGRDDVAIVVHLPSRLDAAPSAPSAVRTRGVAIEVDAAGAVVAVGRGSAAERAGIRVGDVVMSVDRRPGAAGLAGSGPALVALTRNGEPFVVRADRELH
jgi:hypothetical protein